MNFGECAKTLFGTGLRYTFRKMFSPCVYKFLLVSRFYENQ
jgi:hypothetical protein